MWRHSLTVFHIVAVRLDEASRYGYQNNKEVFTTMRNMLHTVVMQAPPCQICPSP